MNGKYYNQKKGSLLLFVHGIGASRHQFYECSTKLMEYNKKAIEGEQKYLDAGVITYRYENQEERNSRLLPDDKDKNLIYYPINIVEDSLYNKYKKLKTPLILLSPEFVDATKRMNGISILTKIRKLTENGYNLMFRTEFSKLDMSNQSEINELGDMVKLLKDARTKLTTVGYSKGAVDVLGFAAQNPYVVSKNILIGAPLLPMKAAKSAYNTFGKVLFKDGVRDLGGLSDSLDKIRTTWNIKPYKVVDTYSFALSWDPFLFAPKLHKARQGKLKINERFGDGIVELNAQLGYDKSANIEFRGMKRYLVEKLDPLAAHHFFETSEPTIVDMMDRVIKDKPLKSYINSKECVLEIDDKMLRSENFANSLRSMANKLLIQKKSEGLNEKNIESKTNAKKSHIMEMYM